MATRKNVTAKSKFPPRRLHDPDLPCHAGAALKMIAFPIGGIGTGTVSLGGRGEWRDWEMFNNPNLNFRPPYTMPYIFARTGKKTVAKVLERRLLPPLHASGGLPPEELVGLPRLAEATFIGTYPFGRIVFQDDDLPVEVALEGFNPMIPGNADDSAIPCAIFTYRLTNRTRQAVTGSVAVSMANIVGLSSPDGWGRNVNAFRDEGDCRGFHMTGEKYAPGTIGHGTAALVTTAKKVTCFTDLLQAGWWDASQHMWDEYSATGRAVGTTDPTPPSDDKRTRTGMLAAEYSLKPGATTSVTFILAWSFPFRSVKNWTIPADATPAPVRNHYAGRFPDAWDAAKYVAKEFARLRSETLRFEQALFESTLPGDVLDAVSSQMSIFRTNTTMWLDSPAGDPQGRIFAYEGCGTKEGCCPMNCTHVWNYEQSLAHLYSALERTMRLTDFTDNLHDAGAMSFRTALPLKAGMPAWNPKIPAADGQFGTVVKAYREWRISGDIEWLKALWPEIRESIRFAWTGFAQWDADKDGVLEGVQHNTYDIDFHGPNTMCGSLYLAALQAGAEMAEAVGDSGAAAEFRQVYDAGREKQDRMLFNGRFYEQKVVEPKEDYTDLCGRSIKAGHPKYQYGKGCLSDQLLGQWAAHVAGLGHILPPAHVKKAMAAIFRHNFKPDLSIHACCQRGYAANEEGGLVACTWPNGRREEFPFPYSDEVWTGIEYQVAAGLIYEGLVDEGLTVVSALRERHDGIARNPWNEFECGDHYARAMSSWSVLLALSGQRYDGRTRTLQMRPVVSPRRFQCIVTGNDAYATYRQELTGGGRKMTVTLEGKAGTISLKSLALAWPGAKTPKKLSAVGLLGLKPLEASVQVKGKELTVSLDAAVELKAGDTLNIVLA